MKKELTYQYKITAELSEVIMFQILPGIISGGTINETHETKTNKSDGKYVCRITGVRRLVRFI